MNFDVAVMLKQVLHLLGCFYPLGHFLKNLFGCGSSALGKYKINMRTERKPGTFSPAIDMKNLITTRNFKRPQWSPNGKEILAASLDGLFKIDVVTRQSMRLGQAKSLKEAIWNRNGTAIYFTDGKDLFSIGADGANEKKMLGPEAHSKEKGNLVLTSDGSKLVFSNGFRLYALALENNAYIELRNCKTGIYAIEAIPNSERLVCSIGNVDYFELFAFDLKTLKRTKLKKWSASGADLVSPSVSPDGQSVLLSMRELNGSQQIYLADIGGKGIVKITEKDAHTYPCFLP